MVLTFSHKHIKKKNPHVEQFKQSIHRILAKYLQTSKKGKKSFT